MRMRRDDEILQCVLQWEGPTTTAYEDFPGITRVSQVWTVLARLNFIPVPITEMEQISLFFASMEQP